MKEIKKQRNSRMCVICGMDNPVGLKAQFYNMEDGSVVCPFRFREEHQSFPQRVHGGLTATMLDEIGLRALWIDKDENVFGVTMSMEVKFRKPVPYNEDLLARAFVVKETTKFLIAKAELYTKGGELLSNAEIRYLKLDVDKIVDNIDEHKEMCYLIEDGVTDIYCPWAEQTEEIYE